MRSVLGRAHIEPIIAAIRPLKNERGGIAGAINCFYDITERKAAEMVSKRLAAIVESSQDAIIGKDLNGIISSWNKGAQKIFGYTAGEMVGTSITRLIPADRRDEENHILEKLKSGESVEHFETLRQTKDGQLINISVTVSPIKDATGKVIGASKVARDITERKRAEEAQRRIEVLAASNSKLKREIARRQTVEKVLQKSEQHHRELLEQSRQMQEQLRHMSHQILHAQEEERKRISRELHDEIAQTLVGITQHLAALTREAATNPKRIGQEIARTQRLVEESVDLVHQFARELRPTALDDLGLIPALHVFMKEFSKRTGICIQLRAFAAVEKLESDKRTILYRVAQEALTNVARHARASRVEVSLRKLPRAFGLTIKDNGKSFQVDRVLHAKKNKRLGLLGMRERVEMVGGSLRVESAPGQGTTVCAQIPFGNPSSRTSLHFGGKRLLSPGSAVHRSALTVALKRTESAS
jgi:PAS domain S-box-containing protein